MRKVFHLIALLALGLAGHSCTEYDEHPVTEAPVTPILCDVRWLKEVTCFALDDTDFRLFKAVRSHPVDWLNQSGHYDSVFVNAEHQPLSYENLTILFYEAAERGSSTDCTPLLLRQNIGRLAQADTECVTEQEKFIRNNLVGKEWAFAAARFNGKACIKADRTLYGLPAGSNLSQHFTVEGRSLGLPQGEFTDFHVLEFENAPSAMDDYFAQGTWLQLLYALRMADIPQEQYDEVTFTVSLPVEYELWWKSQINVEKESHVLSAQCTVRFGQISDFMKEYRDKAENHNFFYW